MATPDRSGVKYILLIPDGMADQPLPQLQGRTPLEAAKTPNMDRLASQGQVGWARTVPEGMSAGSDVACMSLFGYDPAVYHTGRASLEAASLGIELGEDDIVFRCNFVTVQDNTMLDYSAGHITTEESRALVAGLNERLGQHGLTFHAGVSYRNLLVARGHARDRVRTTPPHDIANQSLATHWPEGPDAAWVQLLMRESVGVLRDHPVNAERRRKQLPEATMIWLWGQGTKPNLPRFRSRFGLDGSVITAVDLVRGLGVLAGMTNVPVPGATGYFDTNYQGKAEYALAALELHPFIVVHVEATDEAGHIGSLEEKIKAIEAVDRLVLGTLLGGLDRLHAPYRILISPDHPTLVSSRAHSGDPVPFLVYGNTEPRASGLRSFSERAVHEASSTVIPGYTLMDQLLHERIPAS